MKRKHLSTKEYNFNHVKQRLKERYNIDINKIEYKSLRPILLLFGEEIAFETDQSIYMMPFKGKMAYWVYDFREKLIKTVLPPEDFH